jgi:hypothetical protein
MVRKFSDNCRGHEVSMSPHDGVPGEGLINQAEHLLRCTLPDRLKRWLPRR